LISWTGTSIWMLRVLIVLRFGEERKVRREVHCHNKKSAPRSRPIAGVGSEERGHIRGSPRELGLRGISL